MLEICQQAAGGRLQANLSLKTRLVGFRLGIQVSGFRVSERKGVSELFGVGSRIGFRA